MILSGPAAHFQLELVIDPLAVVGLPLPHPALSAILKQSISRVCEILSLPHMATPQLGFICTCDASADRHICTLAEGTHEATCCESMYDTCSVDDDNRKLCWLDTTPTQRGKDTMHCDSHSHRTCTCTVHMHIYTCIIYMYMYMSLAICNPHTIIDIEAPLIMHFHTDALLIIP